jgi:probable F420-dependent oxidoreductase
VARAADELGYESLWLPEHLVFPATIAASPGGGDRHVEVDPRTPLFDPFVLLASLAAVTERVRLGTNVYNIGLRHPFVTARAAATLDVVSDGRLDLGIGASWLAAEWDAVGLDFDGRGGRVDEALEVCRRLWSEDVVEHAGPCYRFGPVVFEPKPVQAPIPVHVGGDSLRALRRAARLADGWIGMLHDVTSFATSVATLSELCDQYGREQAIQRSALVGRLRAGEIGAWAAAGATRLVVAPWESSRDAVAGLQRLAREAALAG